MKPFLWLPFALVSMAMLTPLKKSNPIQNAGAASFVLNGEAVNPFMIKAFEPMPGERPALISIDFDRANKGNTYFMDNQSNPETVVLADNAGEYSYRLLGKTENGIYVLQTKLVKVAVISQSLMFFSFRKQSPVVENPDTGSLVHLLTLEGFYALGNQKNINATLEGNKVAVEIPGAAKKYINLPVYDDNTGACLSGMALKSDWDELNGHFSFRGKPISPLLLNELNGGGYSLSDGSTTNEIDLEAAIGSKRFNVDVAEDHAYSFNVSVTKTEVTMDSMGFAEIITTGTGQQQFARNSNFNYQYIGKTSNGVHLVRTIDWGSGSGIFGNILFIRFKVRKNFDCNGKAKDQLLMCLETSMGEGDRNSSNISIKNNFVKMDVPIRERTFGEATDTERIQMKFIDAGIFVTAPRQ